MGIEDRDYMRPQDGAAPGSSGKILGMSKGMFFGGILLIAVVGIWKSGLIGMIFPPEPIDLNTASIEQLKDLPGVDKKIAQDILEKRPFVDVDDLKRVKGIGDKSIERLRDLVKVAPGAVSPAPSTPKAPEVPKVPPTPIDVNAATEEQLLALPGVDEKIAKDFIEKRPFSDVDDVKRVKGIGDKKLEVIRPLITVGK